MTVAVSRTATLFAPREVLGVTTVGRVLASSEVPTSLLTLTTRWFA